ncbi:hypothetical protein AVEN_104485-1 [Araneus ventricosus]|uniref:Uncharacterized protein n=1 Tax=Araneus ventricosus TaxID=182803 RepID=A0A4Y2R1R2_ARAVE|nr:hypothetical protein AVEN_104485-1 [Araneus ventricosus]
MGEWTSNDENIPKGRQEISSLPTGENTPKQAIQVFPYPLKEIKLDMSSHVPQYMDDKFTSKYRNDQIRPPLTPRYFGPYPVVSRRDKNFVIYLNGKSTTVSIDCLKPSYEFSEDFDLQKGSSNFEPPITKPQIEDKTSATNIGITRQGQTRSFS